MFEYTILSPYSQKLRNGKNNPKNYPYWKEVVGSLNDKGYKIIQIGSNGESRIDGVSDFIVGAGFELLKELVKEAVMFISVDNFFPHFCAYYSDISGVVVFSQSDPNIFGYLHNINLLKDRSYLRKNQFGIWEEVEFMEDAFVKPSDVVEAVLRGF